MICGTKSKHVITDCELAARRKLAVEKHSFSSNPAVNRNLEINSPSEKFLVSLTVQYQKFYLVKLTNTQHNE
jgi:hypothetical protein